MAKKLLMLSIDRSIFIEGSAVRARQIEYAKDWDEVHILVAADKSFQETTLAPNVWVYPSRYGSKILYPFSLMRLGRFIIERRGITDITCQDPFLTAMAGVSLKKEFKIPLEIQIHTDIGSTHFAYSFGNKIRRMLALNYLQQADTIRVVSERIKIFLTSVIGIPEEQITVRSIVVDTESIKNTPVTADLHAKYPQFEKIVLMASRLEKEKDIALAIKAFGQVVAQFPKAGLVIVGNGSQFAELRALVAKYRLDQYVVFESWADKPTLYSYYKTTNVFLNTSLYEGYGMSLIEAQAAGTKIVSTDVGVAKKAGARITERDPAAVSDAIVETMG